MGEVFFLISLDGKHPEIRTYDGWKASFSGCGETVD